MAKHIEKRLVEQLKAKGKPVGQAHAIARASMKKAGNVTSSGKLTEKGKKRSAMGAAGRAKDRAAKRTGRKASQYTYNARNNTARLKPKAKAKR